MVSSGRGRPRAIDSLQNAMVLQADAVKVAAVKDGLADAPREIVAENLRESLIVDLFRREFLQRANFVSHPLPLARSQYIKFTDQRFGFSPRAPHCFQFI